MAVRVWTNGRCLGLSRKAGLVAVVVGRAGVAQVIRQTSAHAVGSRLCVPSPACKRRPQRGELRETEARQRENELKAKLLKSKVSTGSSAG